jgi:hypothetical protein
MVLHSWTSPDVTENQDLCPLFRRTFVGTAILLHAGALPHTFSLNPSRWQCLEDQGEYRRDDHSEGEKGLNHLDQTMALFQAIASQSRSIVVVSVSIKVVICPYLKIAAGGKAEKQGKLKLWPSDVCGTSTLMAGIPADMPLFRWPSDFLVPQPLHLRLDPIVVRYRPPPSIIVLQSMLQLEAS